MSESASAPVLIVGAGVAGLICAIELHRAGQAVRVLESAPDVGGRVRSTTVNGFVLDHGFQVLFTAYPTLRRYLDAETLQYRRFLPAARIVRDRDVALIGDALAEPRLLVDTVLARGISVTDKLRLLALRRFAKRLTIDACFDVPYAAMSTRTFLESRGFGRAVIDGFFAPFYGGILLDRTLSSSASILLFTFKMLAEGDTVVPAAGMGAITRHLASQLPADAVITNAPIASVIVRDGCAVGVRAADGREFVGANVVLATDMQAMSRLEATAGLSAEPPHAALGCTTVYYTAKRTPIPGTALWLNAAPDAVVSHAITLTDVAPSYSTDGRPLLAATALGDAAMLPDDALDLRVRADLLRMGRSHADDIGLERVAIWRVPYAQYAQPAGSVSHRPSAATSVPGLWRASELLHSSSLEGAARGGVMAADAICHARRNAR
ncbi:MAG: hypothetical protein RLZZ621_2008 [Gemmatimonadota bacterium]|jgi:monoamine oxidase